MVFSFADRSINFWIFWILDLDVQLCDVNTLSRDQGSHCWHKTSAYDFWHSPLSLCDLWTSCFVFWASYILNETAVSHIAKDIELCMLENWILMNDICNILTKRSAGVLLKVICGSSSILGFFSVWLINLCKTLHHHSIMNSNASGDLWQRLNSELSVSVMVKRVALSIC